MAWQDLFGAADGKDSLLSRLIAEEADVRAVLLACLRDAGCVPPTHHVALYCLEKLLLGTRGFLGRKALEALEKLAGHSPKLTALLDRIEALTRKGAQRAEVKRQLLDALGEAAERAGIDQSAEFDVVAAFYSQTTLEALPGHVRDMLRPLFDDLAEKLATLTDPELAWSMQHVAPARAGLAERIQQNAAGFELIGREDELDILHRFLGDPSMPGPLARFRWSLVTGAGGEGKTRLARAFTEDCAEKGWHAGRFSIGALKAFPAAKWRPRKPTLMVIDYPAQAPDGVRDLLIALQGNAPDFDFPVRLLLLERDAAGEWHNRIFPTGGDTAAIRQHGFLPAGVDMKAHAADRGWPLPPVAPDAIIAIMQQRFAALGVAAPAPETLIRAVRAVDPREIKTDQGIIPLPRPLFAVAVAELLAAALKDGRDLETALGEVADRDTVLETIISRTRDQRWKHQAQGQELTLHENLLALGSFGLGRMRYDGLEGEELTPLLARAPLPGFGLRDPYPLNQDLARDMGGDNADQTLPALEPDILGEFFTLSLFQYLTQRKKEKDRQTLIDLAFAIGGDDAGVFILRCLRDFPDRLRSLNFLMPSADTGLAGVQLFAGLLVDLTNLLGEAGKFEELDRLLSHFDTLRTPYPRDRDIALREAMAAANLCGYTNEARERARISAAPMRMERLRQDSPHDSDIALANAKGFFNLIFEASEVQNWRLVDDALARLAHLRQDWPQDSEIALRDARANVNVTNHAGAARDWARVDAALARLDQLRQEWQLDPDIALEYAKAAFNLTSIAGEVQDWARVDAALAILAQLRQERPRDRDIALRDAEAAVDVIAKAGVAEQWARVDAAWERVRELLYAWPGEREVTVQAAKGCCARYHTKCLGGVSPPEDETPEAVAAAETLLNLLDKTRENAGLFRITLQIIADGAARFPENAEIRKIYDHATTGGINFSLIPPLVPPEG